MRVGIISDIHDHIERLNAALRQIQDVEELICCGDLCSPFIVDRLAEGFRGPIHIVFGNNDGDLWRIAEKANAYPNVKLYGEFAELQLGGKRIAVNHFPEIGRAIAASGAYDVVCYGHNHQYEETWEGSTLKLNPGEIMGELTGVCTFAVYDTDTNSVTRYEV